MIKQKKISNRSDRENKYYWGVVVCNIACHLDSSVEYAHNWVKETFGIKTTSKLDTQEFEILMQVVRDHARYHWGVTISPPNN